jgi:hypothetical protein
MTMVKHGVRKFSHQDTENTKIYPVLLVLFVSPCEKLGLV